jgi:sulfatase modifying factor 1
MDRRMGPNVGGPAWPQYWVALAACSLAGLCCAACGVAFEARAADPTVAPPRQTPPPLQESPGVLPSLPPATRSLPTGPSASPRPGSLTALSVTPSPPEPALGTRGTRVADGMTVVFVTSGEFEMGSSVTAIATARALCLEHYTEADIARAVCTRAAFADEAPEHRVSLSSFWIDLTEVTNRQYQRCVEAGTCEPPEDLNSMAGEGYFGEAHFEDYPVIWVRWDQADVYCRWAGGRLPTEAEWEYAARGPQGWLFPWGDAFDPARLNYCDRRCPLGPNDPAHDDGYAETSPVGNYPSGRSWCGALDMAGNVREWVADGYGPYAADRADNPLGAPAGDSKIPRGGSWLDLADNLRSTNRGANATDYAEHKVGFRCVVPAEASDSIWTIAQVATESPGP